MKHLPKVFLTVAIVAFAIGSSELAENIFFYMGRPVGAIFFVLFMIFQFLQKETALYDQQHEFQSSSKKAVTPARFRVAERSTAEEQMHAGLAA